MFKIDFMSSLKEGKINGFDLAIMEQEQEQQEEVENEDQITEYDDDTLPFELEDEEEPD